MKKNIKDIVNKKEFVIELRYLYLMLLESDFTLTSIHRYCEKNFEKHIAVDAARVIFYEYINTDCSDVFIMNVKDWFMNHNINNENQCCHCN